MNIQIVEDPAAELAALLVETAGHVVLTGGSTPRKAYEQAAATPGVDWAAKTLWIGDDRAVAPDDDRSNVKMVRAALLDPLGDAAPVFHPMESADGYESLIRRELGDAPAWDLLVLGLGPDAHCASLFPGQASVAETERLVVDVPIAGWAPQVPRISMTLPCLNAARKVVFLVTGEEKEVAFGRAFGDPSDPASPAAHVRPAGGELLVLADAAAAGRG
jgi:6-phosphogluconolactonase